MLRHHAKLLLKPYVQPDSWHEINDKIRLYLAENSIVAVNVVLFTNWSASLI